MEVSDGGSIPGGIQRSGPYRNLRDVELNWYVEFHPDLVQINDLLGSGQFDTKKHEIKHDKEGKMTVTDVVSSGLPHLEQLFKRKSESDTMRSPAEQPATSFDSPRPRSFSPSRRCDTHERAVFSFTLCLHPKSARSKSADRGEM